MQVRSELRNALTARGEKAKRRPFKAMCNDADSFHNV